MFPIRRSRLQTRIVVLSVFSTLVMLAVFSVSSVLTVRESVDRTLNERLVLAQTAASLTDNVLNQNMRYLQDVAMNPSIDLEDGDLEPERRAIRDAYFHSIFTDGVYIIRGDGTLLLREPARPDGRAEEIFSYPHVVEALDRGRPLVSNIYQTTTTRRPTISIVYPIRNSQRQVVGLVGGDIDVTNPTISSIIDPVRVGSTGYSQIVDGNGIVVASGRKQDVLKESDHGDFLAALIRDRQTGVGTCHDCHGSAQTPQRETEVMAFAPLSAAAWGVIIRQSESEALAPTERLRQQFILFSFTVLGLALLLAWAIAQSVVRPVAALTDAAERIASGDLTEAIEPMGEDEIGILARSFDGMRLRLKESLEKIQEWNRELELSVQLRTRELKDSQQMLLQRNQELSLMNAIGGAVSQSLNLRPSLESALDEVVRFAGAEVATVSLYPGPDDEGEMAVFGGYSQEAAAAASKHGPCKRRTGEDTCEHQPNGPCALRQSLREIHPDLPEGELNAVTCVAICSKGETLGKLCISGRQDRQPSPVNAELLSSITRQIAVAVENARLYRELERKEELRGELLRKVISAQEEERKRIARELHDDTSQALAALGLALETASVAPAGSVEEVKARISAIKPLAVRMLDEVRKLTLDLRPTVLDDLGLIPAIRWYADHRLKPQGVDVHLETSGEEHRLSPEQETALFRVMQEAMNNVVWHAEAESVVISVDFTPAAVTIEVEDDGKGFDLAEVSRASDKGRGLGLMGMRERVALFSGVLTIDTAPGAGTRLRIEVPVEGSSNGKDQSADRR